MSHYYTNDGLIRRVMNDKLSSAAYIYTFDEASAEDGYQAIIIVGDWALSTLVALLKLDADVSYAVVAGSTSPFQVCHTGDNSFVVLIDAQAYYQLMNLCSRLQSLPPLADKIGTPCIAEPKDYTGKYLLDITRDMIFHRDDIGDLLTPEQTKIVVESAIFYIFAHEVAHIAHGHLEFLKSPEFCHVAINEEDRRITMKTLEMDADALATTSVLAIFEHAADRTLAGSYSDQTSKEEKLLLYRFQYTLGMFIALIFQDTLATNHEPKNYPIGYARFLTTSDALEQVFPEIDPRLSGITDHVRQLLIDAFVGLSGSLDNLGHPIATNVHVIDPHLGPVERSYHPDGVKAGLAHLEPLDRRWSRIRPSLEKFQRGGRLAPADANPG